MSWLDEGQCSSCKHCSIDMDMEPFCLHPKVQANHVWGLNINSAIKNYCGEELKLREKKMLKKIIPSDEEILKATKVLIAASHGRAWNAGWFHDPLTGEEIQPNMGERFALIHSEISEALEGYRKDLMDDKLPHRKMVPVELFDAAIRIFDTIGRYYPEDAPALLEKMKYNDSRADHKPENRIKPNGKKF